jgi:hypothetical protein
MASNLFVNISRLFALTALGEAACGDLAASLTLKAFGQSWQNTPRTV